MRVPSLSTVRFAVLVALVLALFTSGIVVGAAGAPLILGQVNSGSGQLTTLKSGGSATAFQVVNPGTGRALEVSDAHAVPLKITAPSGQAPMSVNTSAKVVNLNADRVDGKSSGAFMPSATYRASGYETVAANSGAYITASCDAGDRLLGGGFWNVSTTTHVWDSYPTDADTWQVVLVTGANSNVVYAWAVCADLGAAHVTTLAVEEPQRDGPLPTSGD